MSSYSWYSSSLPLRYLSIIRWDFLPIIRRNRFLDSSSPSLTPQNDSSFSLRLFSTLQKGVTPSKKVRFHFFFDEKREGIDSSVDSSSFFAQCRFFARCRRSSLAVVFLRTMSFGRSSLAQSRRSLLFRRSSSHNVVRPMSLHARQRLAFVSSLILVFLRSEPAAWVSSHYLVFFALCRRLFSRINQVISLMIFLGSSCLEFLLS